MSTITKYTHTHTHTMKKAGSKQMKKKFEKLKNQLMDKNLKILPKSVVCRRLTGIFFSKKGNQNNQKKNRFANNTHEHRQQKKIE